MIRPPRLLLLAWLAGCLTLFVPSAGAGLPTFRPQIRIAQGIRADLRGQKDEIPSELTGRLELELLPASRKWRLFPFAEGRLSLDRSVWSRVEAGAELGFQPVSWFYLGNGLHHAWTDAPADRPEWEIRTVFTAPLPWQVRERKLELYALNEYTYNLDDGRDFLNEVGAGVRLPLPHPSFEAQLGWRHVDLIHSSDMDQFEASLRARF